MNVEEKVIHLLSIFFNTDQSLFTENTQASEIAGWDSLAHAELLLKIEKEFSIVFSLSDLMSMGNVGSLIEIVNKKCL